MSFEYIVQPSEIEKQLTKIWDTLQGTGKTRASLFNLIIYTAKNARTDYLYQVAKKLIEKFPSRVILITIDDSAPSDTVKTSVSVMASESKTNTTACDLINIVLSTKNKERAPFMVLPHLLTDLPIYLLWGDDPSKIDPISQKLEKLATRVIFDSESTKDLVAFAKAILNHKTASGSDIADLNWARTEGWRQLLAETFKSPERLNLLTQTKTLSIVYNCLESEFFCHTKIQALYLQAWLASQMGWDLTSTKTSPQETQLEYNKKITVILTPKSVPSLTPGRILEINFAGSDDSHFQFVRSKESPQIVQVRHSTPHFCQLPLQFILDRYESGQSLIKEIFHKGTSKHYLSILQKLSQVADKDLKAYE